ncbi:MAG: hypothetical protein Q9162_003105 [Coniocarpon cinnabarinum]
MAPIAFTDGLPTPPEEYPPQFKLDLDKPDSPSFLKQLDSPSFLQKPLSPSFPQTLCPNDTILFGGDDVWLYDKTTRRFDLSRESMRKLTIPADEAVRDHRGCVIDPDKTVLLVVDMQNFFIHPDCCPHPEGLKAVQPTLKVIERCREFGIQVTWLNWGIDEWNLRRMPPAVHRAFSRARAQATGHGWTTNLGSELPNGQGRCLWKGAWNTELYPPLQEVCRPEDMCFYKDRPSGMWSPEEPLHRWLREAGKTSIIFTGVNTDQCVLGTLTDSYSHGFDCIMVGDCVGTLSGRNANSLCDFNVSTIYGFVTESDAILKATMA